MNNQEKLVNAYTQALEIPATSVVDDLKYNTIPEWDSTAHMLLVAELEAQFDVMFDTDDIIDMSSVAICKQLLIKHGISFD
ncbi:acyl carrier protein [Agarivorans sp. B2Z047]|uniref:acyl carrier protein n=1 Tax=Agarivorans sp. B2Z047 TaxID=2652721 RepID=UPI00128D70B0|nr:acyl carrier protein [Agarivorans sp. B2Z047]MPW28669.1 acyl carrier protein [Agarivorans sp. B2Z047]UQN41230.1 acyl carrier protein [Agarivorans sp. B2Z047]